MPWWSVQQRDDGNTVLTISIALPPGHAIGVGDALLRMGQYGREIRNAAPPQTEIA